MPFDGMYLGRYKLVRILGRGGMGEVYLADDPRINRQVAIKVIRSEASAYPNLESARHATQLFEREMQTISSLDHPHILPIFDYGEGTIGDTSLTYMVMPYRPEGSLDTWLRERTSTGLLSSQEVAVFVMQIGSALQHAHDRHVIHQDVKPSNFLVRLNEERPQLPDLFLADFGVARFTSATSSSSQTIRGTPTYMAPEQWEGHPTFATDQYALAVMSYELLVGRPPFEGGPSPVMFKHMTAQPVPLTTSNPFLPVGLNVVVLQGLAKRPEARFPSVLEYAKSFQQAAWAGDSSKGAFSGSNLPTVMPQSQMPTVVRPLVSSGDYMIQNPAVPDIPSGTQLPSSISEQATRISSTGHPGEDPIDDRTLLPNQSDMSPNNEPLVRASPVSPTPVFPLASGGGGMSGPGGNMYANTTEPDARRPKEKRRPPWGIIAILSALVVSLLIAVPFVVRAMQSNGSNSSQGGAVSNQPAKKVHTSGKPLSCVYVSPQALALTDASSSQKITVKNCGNPGNWSAKVMTDKGGNWLNLDKKYGILNSQAYQTLAVQANSNGLGPGYYTGHIALQIGSSSPAMIKVGLQVKAPSPTSTAQPVATPTPVPAQNPTPTPAPIQNPTPTPVPTQNPTPTPPTNPTPTATSATPTTTSVTPTTTSSSATPTSGPTLNATPTQ